MKCPIVCILVFFALFAVAFCADCRVGTHSFNKGESYQEPGKCWLNVCKGPGRVIAQQCSYSSSSSSGCRYVPEDNSKRFPDCCRKFKC